MIVYVLNQVRPYPNQEEDGCYTVAHGVFSSMDLARKYIIANEGNDSYFTEDHDRADDWIVEEYCLDGQKKHIGYALRYWS